MRRQSGPPITPSARRCRPRSRPDAAKSSRNRRFRSRPRPGPAIGRSEETVLTGPCFSSQTPKNRDRPSPPRHLQNRRDPARPPFSAKSLPDAPDGKVKHIARRFRGDCASRRPAGAEPADRADPSVHGRHLQLTACCATSRTSSAPKRDRPRRFVKLELDAPLTGVSRRIAILGNENGPGKDRLNALRSDVRRPPLSRSAERSPPGVSLSEISDAPSIKPFRERGASVRSLRCDRGQRLLFRKLGAKRPAAKRDCCRRAEVVRIV